MYQGTMQYKKKIEEYILEHSYVKGAFGLKLRGDLNGYFDDFAYQSALRTFINMSIQSYAMLMNRTIFEFQDLIEGAGLEDKVLLQNTVHDSIYLMVVPDPEVIKWVNENLIKTMVWLPDYCKDWEIQNEADLELGVSYKAQVSLDNGASVEDIKEKLKEVG